VAGRNKKVGAPNRGAPFFVGRIGTDFPVASHSNPTRADFAERNFKYLLVGPAIFVLLLIGIFPLIYLLMVSFQGITMTETGTDFVGGRNYAQLFDDSRMWEALLHTVIFTAIALPVELLLGLAMAQLFPRPGPRATGFHCTAGAAGGRVADRFRRDLGLDVRSPIRTDQPGYRLVHRRYRGDSLDDQTKPGVSGDPRSGNLAMDPFHVSAAARGARQRRQIAA
jgi:hypothetical protein